MARRLSITTKGFFMKKTNLKKLAATGLAGGLLLANSTAYADSNHEGMNQYNESSKQNNENKTISESDLLSQLNAEGKTAYENLDAEGKKLALKLASQTCKAKNECKGLNSCKTSKNSCAGQGGCRGTSKGPFTDKNTAVTVAMKKMAEKRSESMNGGNHN